MSTEDLLQTHEDLVPAPSISESILIQQTIILLVSSNLSDTYNLSAPLSLTYMSS